MNDVKLLVLLLGVVVVETTAETSSYSHIGDSSEEHRHVGVGRHHSHSSEEHHGYGKNIVRYKYGYDVNGGYKGGKFGHHESRDGDLTRGEYHVHLPDGRILTVNYYVNGDSGFVADVSYEGDARYDSGGYDSHEANNFLTSGSDEGGFGYEGAGRNDGSHVGSSSYTGHSGVLGSLNSASQDSSDEGSYSTVPTRGFEYADAVHNENSDEGTSYLPPTGVSTGGRGYDDSNERVTFTRSHVGSSVLGNVLDDSDEKYSFVRPTTGASFRGRGHGDSDERFTLTRPSVGHGYRGSTQGSNVGLGYTGSTQGSNVIGLGNRGSTRGFNVGSSYQAPNPGSTYSAPTTGYGLGGSIRGRGQDDSDERPLYFARNNIGNTIKEFIHDDSDEGLTYALSNINQLGYLNSNSLFGGHQVSNGRHSIPRSRGSRPQGLSRPRVGFRRVMPGY